MKVASITDAAISHGLKLGVHSRTGPGLNSVAAASPLVILLKGQQVVIKNDKGEKENGKWKMFRCLHFTFTSGTTDIPGASMCCGSIWFGSKTILTGRRWTTFT